MLLRRLPLPGRPPSGADVLTGLVGAYRLDGSGTDTSGAGNDMTLIGGSYTAGLLGQALDGFIIASSSPVAGLVTTQPATVSFWAKVDAVAPDGGGRLVGWQADAHSPNVAIKATTAAGYGVQFNIGALEVRAPAYGEIPADAGWHQLAFTWTGAGQGWSVYADGAAVVSGTTAAGSDSFITFGIDAGSFNPPIDMILVYDRALSADEIAALYNGGAGFDPTA